MNKILVATIGTRELMFQVDDGTWYNVGNDRQDDDIISQQNQVTASLGLDWEEYKSYRKLTKYLLDNLEQYQNRIKPVIWGKLFQDLQGELKKVYLLCTDQPESVSFRTRDTIYGGQIIAHFLKKLGLDVEIITFGKDGINPSDFEQMFRWWQRVWDQQIIVDNDDLILCLKGGVGQTAEAGRTSALGFFGERVEFYDSQENQKLNQQGMPSEYIGPTLGANYLWSRVQKQALELLKNHNYLAVQGLLAAYFKQDTKGWGSTPTLLKGAIAWNQGQFDTFFKHVKNDLDNSQKSQDQNYWWQAYEQAYTAVIRLKQDNTTEAMLHSFRTIEGLIYEWIQEKFKKYINYVDSQGTSYPVLKNNILSIYPNLRDLFERFDQENKGTVKISGEVQAALVLQTIPEAGQDPDFKAWNSKNARDTRNRLSHRLGGIDKRDLFLAWGTDIHKPEHWQQRLLGCINLITGQTFSTFEQASLFPIIHHQLQKKINNYQV
ncbi:MAG: hypothetical protein HC796_02960 [Synechococcaceae cyanobacterium RL_1_2]|nr:hypothetical protein [Synechococcaceae cyanobacterium RL_1_2]